MDHSLCTPCHQCDHGHGVKDQNRIASDRVYAEVQSYVAIHGTRYMYNLSQTSLTGKIANQTESGLLGVACTIPRARFISDFKYYDGLLTALGRVDCKYMIRTDGDTDDVIVSILWGSDCKYSNAGTNVCDQQTSIELDLLESKWNQTTRALKKSVATVGRGSSSASKSKIPRLKNKKKFIVPDFMEQIKKETSTPPEEPKTHDPALDAVEESTPHVTVPLIDKDNVSHGNLKVDIPAACKNAATLREHTVTHRLASLRMQVADVVAYIFQRMMKAAERGATFVVLDTPVPKEHAYLYSAIIDDHFGSLHPDVAFTVTNNLGVLTISWDLPKMEEDAKSPDPNPESAPMTEVETDEDLPDLEEGVEDMDLEDKKEEDEEMKEEIRIPDPNVPHLDFQSLYPSILKDMELQYKTRDRRYPDFPVDEETAYMDPELMKKVILPLLEFKNERPSSDGHLQPQIDAQPSAPKEEECKDEPEEEDHPTPPAPVPVADKSVQMAFALHAFGKTYEDIVQRAWDGSGGNNKSFILACTVSYGDAMGMIAGLDALEEKLDQEHEIAVTNRIMDGHRKEGVYKCMIEIAYKE